MEDENDRTINMESSDVMITAYDGLPLEATITFMIAIDSNIVKDSLCLQFKCDSGWYEYDVCAISV